MNHFIAITDHPTDWLQHVLDVSKRLKNQLKESGRNEPILAGKTLAMIFEKPSLRTRVSFSTGMVQLGGASLMLRGEEMGWGHREEVRDVARVVASMCDGIMARTPGGTGESHRSATGRLSVRKPEARNPKSERNPKPE